MTDTTDTVLVAPHSSGRECYHDPDCDRAADHFAEMDRDRAERSGLRKCGYCLGSIDYDEHDNPDRSYYEYALEAE